MLLMIGIIGVVILSNVLFTMVTQKHLRTGTNVKEYKDPDISSSNVLKAKRGTIYDLSLIHILTRKTALPCCRMNRPMPVFLRPYKRGLTRKLHLYRLNGVTADGFGRIRIV